MSHKRSNYQSRASAHNRKWQAAEQHEEGLGTNLNVDDDKHPVALAHIDRDDNEVEVAPEDRVPRISCPPAHELVIVAGL